MEGVPWARYNVGSVLFPFLLMRTLYLLHLQLVSNYQGLPWYVRGQSLCS